MKPKNYLTIMALGAMAVSSGYAAVTKCVSATYGVCTSVQLGADMQYDQPCYKTGSSGATVITKNIAVCGSRAGNSIGSSYTSVLVDEKNSENNKNCWCRMIYPAVSSWHFAGPFNDVTDCMYNCASRCAQCRVVGTFLFSGFRD